MTIYREDETNPKVRKLNSDLGNETDSELSSRYVSKQKQENVKIPVYILY